ncbi:MAG: hypothetical protein UW37_C0021G0012 [Candidatus Gottesmanbacteria bacterium GW2011_GWA2_44_17]|uniref:Uncharacterized protein n=3 Tax=Candidatus Gottesmaniibacteriota TaxID=1752720 RepID=A0A0G1KVA2_9BACT|nr:MAG: hypothetical protein UV63_C0034G0014 [Microgenomates group bacterium GW2011_GWC1_43_11]KKT38020.1 MAG: hypothetical protein UW22_C0015G0030 [Candidatus Gottesmanbacteria bacterium GW2011_GWB1_44_11c]KKT46587.1 MAG: hypothetical protein UW37_C0021G0012 [Candidatus Gottesmanbacteria bacterium GW2011_GWA2_44_17]KKT60247.1 MAG: hypothetical protein UW52_C0028G0012 [Candidatus Gottesmanbacteria bacterium GW2011_GWA1_44_24b]HCM82681.1 hypothetical protein [Patescibacteria group bacterium]
MITDADVTKLEKKFATKADLVNFKDVILHEIKGLREDVAIVTGYKDQIEDIDYRVERLEKHTKIPPVAS